MRAWSHPSPVGDLFVVEGGTGVCRVDLRGDAGCVADFGDVEVLDAPPGDGAGRELSEYFEGRRNRFDVPVDLSAVGGFHRTVLETLHTDVEWGEVVSYGELAELAGRPGAARAVGTAMSRNPVPIIVPCHRVVAAGGRPGGYGPGLAMKRTLLALEDVDLDALPLVSRSPRS